MTRTTTNLGGTAYNVVGKVAHGLMIMTHMDPDEQCFEAIKSGIDALPLGAKMFLTGGAWILIMCSIWSLQLLNRFFERYPEYVDKMFLSIKAGLSPMQPGPNLSARVDPNIPVEVSIAALAKLKSEGKLDHIGMTKCSAETLRHGHKTHDVIAAAKELGVAVAAYSPLGRRFLTGQIKRPEYIPEGDIHRHLPRFQDDNLRHNFAIVDTLTELVKKKDITPAQLSIA
ncbi:NADP-dependent oxidoreductase domain-containing protein [Boletus edulis BED1]|uniref:NADP-dependent oxidoreductase domain-containing protein n=1 Tax=Boletus edulis BED1 TaxID=1328754 RepID=A0AAD4G9V9_BOLED|nr:NADP-dependent oxidoreductase domain-containing protein [Boletus edulis BED1]